MRNGNLAGLTSRHRRQDGGGLLCGRCGDSWSNPRRCRVLKCAQGDRGLSVIDRVLLLPAGFARSGAAIAGVPGSWGYGVSQIQAHRDDHALAARNTEPALVVTSGCAARSVFSRRGWPELMSRRLEVAPGGTSRWVVTHSRTLRIRLVPRVRRGCDSSAFSTVDVRGRYVS